MQVEAGGWATSFKDACECDSGILASKMPLLREPFQYPSSADPCTVHSVMVHVLGL